MIFVYFFVCVEYIFMIGCFLYNFIDFLILKIKKKNGGFINLIKFVLFKLLMFMRYIYIYIFKLDIMLEVYCK